MHTAAPQLYHHSRLLSAPSYAHSQGSGDGRSLPKTGRAAAPRGGATSRRDLQQPCRSPRRRSEHTAGRASCRQLPPAAPLLHGAACTSSCSSARPFAPWPAAPHSGYTCRPSHQGFWQRQQDCNSTAALQFRSAPAAVNRPHACSRCRMPAVLTPARGTPHSHGEGGMGAPPLTASKSAGDAAWEDSSAAGVPRPPLASPRSLIALHMCT